MIAPEHDAPGARQERHLVTDKEQQQSRRERILRAAQHACHGMKPGAPLGEASKYVGEHPYEYLALTAQTS
jgi:hypothetical protein